MEYQTIANPDGTISIVPINQQQGIMVPAYETSQLDLVNQINQRPRNIGAPMTLEETMAGSVLPSDPRRFQSIFPTTGIMQQAPTQNFQQAPTQNFEFLSSAYEDDNAEQVDSLTGEKKSGGILDLIMSIAIPGYGFLKDIGKGGFEGIRGLNQRLQQSDFGRSKTLADYFATKRNKRFTGQDDPQGGPITTFRNVKQQAQDKIDDRGRGQPFSAPTRSAATTRSRDLGSMRGGVGR